MIKSLQTIRGIGAVMIFAHHFGFISHLTDAFGDCGVSWFMMLSGFVLTGAFEKRRESLTAMRWKETVTGFMNARLRRIYPLYFIMMLAMLLIMRFDISLSVILSHIFLIQSWIPDPEYYFGLNGPSWFLSDLFLCYFLFIPALHLLYTRRRLVRTLTVVGIILYYVIICLVPAGAVDYIVYIFPLMQLPTFLAGMMLWRVYAGIKSGPIGGLAGSITTIGVILLTAAAILCYPYVTQRLTLSSYWWIPTSTLILALSLQDKSGSLIMKILTSRPLVAFGDVSFSFYIMHLPWIMTFRILLKKGGISLSTGTEFCLSLMLLIIISFAVHRLLNHRRIKHEH